jgi:tetratricopeptide (TPR) repeat protein
MNVASSGSLNAAIEHASAVLGVDPPRALREAEAILKLAPADPRARLIAGSARRRLGDVARAKAILAPLAAAYPRAAHTQYELGLVLEASGERQKAIVALRNAVAARRDLAEAWRALGDLLFLEGDAAGAEAAFAEHGRASIQNPALRPAAEALFAGRIGEAERLLRPHLLRHVGDAVALRLLGEALLRQERHGDAEVVLAQALRLDPDDHGARFSYATALFHQQKAAAALAEAKMLLGLEPREAAYLNLLAGCLTLLGDFDRAIDTYENLLATYARQPRIWLNQGHVLRTVGRREDAVNAYRRAVSLAPGLGDAYWSLANLKVAALSGGDEAAIEAQLARSDLDPEDRLHLCYALGKALEDRGAYPDAFQRYAAGAALRRRTLAYDADEQTAFARRSMTLFTPAFFAARAGAGSLTPDPIFIVGLPRSGSTLIEQILASHSAVEGTMELPEIGLFASSLGEAGAGGYPDCVAGLSRDDLRSLGELFLDRTRIQRKLDRPFFIDKMPNNFRHIGLIHLILPNAKIIDARRHPLATCFSAFKQHFAQGQSFSYDLTDLGRYYRDYLALMAHFDAVLPGRIHRVIYEDMVENTEAEVRRLLDYCGLPFEAACLKFHENDRAVRTVSSEQVRQPIFRQGLDQWRHFEPWLGPLKEALGPALETWRAAQGATRSGGQLRENEAPASPSGHIQR